MPNRQIRLLLWLASGLLCFGAAVAMVASQWIEIEPDNIKNELASAPISRPRPLLISETKLNEQDFRYVWGKPLRRQLSNPVPTAPVIETVVEAAAVVPKTRLDAKLIATLVDADPIYATAWISCKNKTQKVAIGDSLQNHPGNPLVTAIKDGHVEVLLGGESRTLKLADNLLLASRKDDRDIETQRGD